MKLYISLAILAGVALASPMVRDQALVDAQQKVNAKVQELYQTYATAHVADAKNIQKSIVNIFANVKTADERAEAIKKLIQDDFDKKGVAVNLNDQQTQWALQ